MKKYLYLSAIFLFLILSKVSAQDAIHIGIIPFKAIDRDAEAIANLVEEQVSACFANKGRFYLLDRSVTEKLKKELEAAKENTSLYSKIVAEQGHMAGAEYLITGKVTSVEYTKVNGKNYLGQATTTYHGTLRVSVQINTVETGRVFFNEPYTILSRDFDTDAKSDILDNILCKLKTAIKIKVRDMFPTSLAIVHIEKEKKGIPDQVLINAGKDLFETGKTANCDVPSALSSISSIFSSKIVLEVIEVETLTFGSAVSKREKKIGELKITSVEGDVSVCIVSKGGKEIKDAMDNKKVIIIRQPTQ
jgi:hypothetical protein